VSENRTLQFYNTYLTLSNEYPALNINYNQTYFILYFEKKKTFMNIIKILLISVAFAVLGQITWKYGMNQIGNVHNINLDLLFCLVSNPYIICGVGMYGISTLFWLSALSKGELSYVYPFTALTFIGIVLASKYIFSEDIGVGRMIGTLMVLFGLMLIIKFE